MDLSFFFIHASIAFIQHGSVCYYASRKSWPLVGFLAACFIQAFAKVIRCERRLRFVEKTDEEIVKCFAFGYFTCEFYTGLVLLQALSIFGYFEMPNLEKVCYLAVQILVFCSCYSCCLFFMLGEYLFIWFLTTIGYISRDLKSKIEIFGVVVGIASFIMFEYYSFIVNSTFFLVLCLLFEIAKCLLTLSVLVTILTCKELLYLINPYLLIVGGLLGYAIYSEFIFFEEFEKNLKEFDTHFNSKRERKVLHSFYYESGIGMRVGLIFWFICLSLIMIVWSEYLGSPYHKLYTVFGILFLCSPLALLLSINTSISTKNQFFISYTSIAVPLASIYIVYKYLCT